MGQPLPAGALLRLLDCPGGAGQPIAQGFTAPDANLQEDASGSGGLALRLRARHAPSVGRAGRGEE
jgi:hypothetical protein